MNRFTKLLWLSGLSAAAPFAHSADTGMQHCAEQFRNDAAARLQCFDDLLKTPASPATASPQATEAAASPAPQTAAAPSAAEDAGAGQHARREDHRSFLTRAWNLDDLNSGDNRFGRLRPHKQNYLIFRKTSRPNQYPSSPTHGQTLIPYNLDAAETKYQLSFKSEIGNRHDFNVFGFNDFRVWAAYSQQSNWQMFNSSNSAPFRETNYEPEVIASFGTDAQSGLKLVNLGFSHQSNGRAGKESRSWNRIYLQGGWEWDEFSLLARGWWRVPEKPWKDDNPDIEQFMGRGDLVAHWEPHDRSQSLSFLVRNNLRSRHNHGYMQLDWAIPLKLGNAARFHLQLGSGYGESMLDYNHAQNTLGIGFSFREW